jgi:hypothetical protein
MTHMHKKSLKNTGQTSDGGMTCEPSRQGTAADIALDQEGCQASKPDGEGESREDRKSHARPATRKASTGSLILSRADSLARTFPMPENALGLKASEAVYGPSSQGSFAFFDLDSFSWRTQQRLLDGALEEFSGTWPIAGMTWNGIAYPVPPSVPFISGIGSFFWPTPTANARRDGGVDRWGGSNARKALQKRIDDEEQLGRMYTTPTADDTGHRKKPYSQGGEALSYQIGGPVNPEWEEWLMGLPMGWTDVGCLETQ